MRANFIRATAVAAVLAVASWQSSAALAQHGHGGSGHGGSGHSGGHDSGHGHSDFHGHDGHFDGHGDSHGHFDVHLGSSFYYPYFLGQNYGYGYYVDPGYDYYYSAPTYYSPAPTYVLPQTYAGQPYVTQPNSYGSQPDAYVAAKPVSVEFGRFAHVDELAGRLERLANELCLDMNYNYQHNAAFADTYQEAYRILETARFLNVKDNQSDRAEVARRVQELEPTFKHVQAEAKRWSRVHQKQVGDAGIITKSDQMDAILHNLMADVGVNPHGPQAAESLPNSATNEIAPPPRSAMPTLPPPAKMP